MKPATNLSDVISATLAAEFGTAVAAGIGMFEQDQPQAADLPAAQARFAHLLAGLVVAAHKQPAQILLAGTALEPLGKELVSRGYVVTWLAGPNAEAENAQVAAALRMQAETLLSVVTTARFDCLVMMGTYRYLDQLPILNRCRELLVTGGTLLFATELLSDDSSIEYSSLANCSSQQQLGARLGFSCVNSWDLSSSALQSVSLFLPLLEKHAVNLRAGSSLPATAWAEQGAVLATMQRELASGRRSYQLQQWCLQDAATDALLAKQLGEYAEAEYGDINSFEVAEIRHLFEQSFEKVFDPALWRWKYQLGDGKCVVARITRGSEIVAHYGGAPRQILYFGKPAKAIQVCDVMVLPEKRRQYGKSSLFFKTAATFLEREIGNSVNHLLGFGFPNQSAMNIATRLGLYDKTDDFVEVVFGPAHASAQPVRFRDFDAGSALQLQQLNQLWLEMAADFAQGIIGLRDAPYIKYRYGEHPGAARGQFRCLLLSASESGEAYALIVLKQHGDSQLLMDMVCATARIPEVINAANQLVKDQQLGTSLRLWLTRGWLGAIPLAGAIVNELNIEIPCNSWNPGPTAAELYGKWWLTAGDMDFM